jgi:hypothetical protein
MTSTVHWSQTESEKTWYRNADFLPVPESGSDDCNDANLRRQPWKGLSEGIGGEFESQFMKGVLEN